MLYSLGRLDAALLLSAVAYHYKQHTFWRVVFCHVHSVAQQTGHVTLLPMLPMLCCRRGLVHQHARPS